MQPCVCLGDGAIDVQRFLGNQNLVTASKSMTCDRLSWSIGAPGEGRGAKEKEGGGLSGRSGEGKREG